jgi:hypothetical protein
VRGLDSAGWAQKMDICDQAHNQAGSIKDWEIPA